MRAEHVACRFERCGPPASLSFGDRQKMRNETTFVLLIALLFAGCATRTVSVQTLTPLQTPSSYHPLFYVGSDEQYHYFDYLNLKTYEHYRVPRSELQMPQEFARGSGRSDVMLPGTLQRASAR